MDVPVLRNKRRYGPPRYPPLGHDPGAVPVGQGLRWGRAAPALPQRWSGSAGHEPDRRAARGAVRVNSGQCLGVALGFPPRSVGPLLGWALSDLSSAGAALLAGL